MLLECNFYLITKQTIELSWSHLILWCVLAEGFWSAPCISQHMYLYFTAKRLLQCVCASGLIKVQTAYTPYALITTSQGFLCKYVCLCRCMTSSDLISSAKPLLNHMIALKSFNSCIGYSVFDLTNNAYAHNIFVIPHCEVLKGSSPVPSKTHLSSFSCL